MLRPNASPPATVSSPFAIPGRNEAEVALAFAIPRCAEGVKILSRLRLRYRIFGREQSQLVRLDPAIAARCSRHNVD
jgi:hypothetical protein